MSKMFNKEMVRLRRLELPRGISPTATSTLRVYQFRHSRTIRSNAGGSKKFATLPLVSGLRCPLSHLMSK